jgi:hypothetical protein
MGLIEIDCFDRPIARRSRICARAGLGPTLAGRAATFVHRGSAYRWRSIALLGLASLSSIACAAKRSQPPEQAQEANAESPSAEATRARKPTPERPAVPAAADMPFEQGANAARPAAKDWKKELIGLPETVLVGTDVTPLAEFLSSAAPIPKTGIFRSEQGGASAQVRIDTASKGSTLTREFAEPGTTAQIKRYDSLRNQADGVRLSGKGVEVLGTARGILVLEKSSGVDGIPDSLWIVYEPTSPNKSAKGAGK